MSEHGDHYIYVMGTRREGALVAPVKVGITKNPASRVRQVSTGSPYGIGVVFLFCAPDRLVAREIEQAFHSVYKRYRLSGEWFDMPPSEAVARMCICMKAAFSVNLPGLSDDERNAVTDLSGVAEAWSLVGLPGSPYGGPRQ